MHTLIHPTSGLYCVAVAASQGFHHKFFSDLASAVEAAQRLDAVGRTVYLAQASFITDENRRGANVHALRSFFLDIDCGADPKYTYKTKAQAATALVAFIKASGLPMPMVTDSGGGLYAHWPITHDIAPQQWRTVAQVFKQVVVAYDPGLQDDSTRTADMASVLRPWGTTNRKPGREERIVELKNPQKFDPPCDLRTFVTKLGAAAKAVNLKPTIHKAPAPPSIDDEFQIYQNTPSFGEIILTKCEQVRQMAASGGDVGYEHWRGVIGLLKHCEDGWELAHEWSAKRAENHTQVDVEAKWETWSTGPTTCTFFSDANPGGCVGCRNKDRVKSPILLGRPAPEPVAQQDPDEIAPPSGFTRSEQGLYFADGDIQIKFLNSDLYPVSLAFDESLGYEVMTLRHKMPHNGWREFPIRSALIHDSKALMTALTDNHVYVIGAKEKKIMEHYIGSYAERLQASTRTGRLLCQMGWKDLDGEQVFVLGRKVFRPGGKVDVAALARNIPPAAEAFTTKGDLAKWIDATRYLDMPGMEPLAFTFLAGAFGAPLMKFTGYDGAMICTLGKSGLGKTLTARWIQSVYGEHSRLMMLRDDTKNSLVSRLGVYGNLPLTIDEVTNITAEELSDLVYRITQGRDKARLTKNAVERGAVNHWNTLAVVSSNASLSEKLAGLKMDASAELNRLFEFEVMPVATFGRDQATDVFRTITENYGQAGEVYISRLVDGVANHQAQIDKLTKHIEAKAQMTMEERYWAAVASAALYGGALARACGLIDMDLNRVMSWVINTIRGMQDEKMELATDPVSILGTFLDEHSQNRIAVEKDRAGKDIIHEMPKGSLHIRVEISNDKIFISRARFKDWVMRKGGNYTQTRRGLELLGVLTQSDRRKVLGAGTHMAGAAQPCLEINLKAPNLGRVAATLVEEVRKVV